MFTSNTTSSTFVLANVTNDAWWNNIVDVNSTRNGWLSKMVLHTCCLVYLTAKEEMKATIITPAPNQRFVDFCVETSVAEMMRKPVSNIPNLFWVFIVYFLSLWFCASALSDSQVKTFFWLMKLRKNQGKIVKCLLFQPSLDCCQEHECSHKVQELSSLALKVSHKQKIIVFETFWSNHFFTSNVIKCENWKSWSSGAQGVPFKLNTFQNFYVIPLK